MPPMRATEASTASGWSSMVSWWKSMTPPCQRCLVPRLRKLVVGTAADDAATQATDGRVIQNRAERRRGEHIDVLGVDFFGYYQSRTIGGGGLCAAVRVEVTDHQCRPCCGQVAAQWHTDIAQPLDRDSQPLQVA